MSEHIVVVGMGQLGAVFSEGFLRTGRSVTPVLRGGDVTRVCEQVKPDAVLVATGEDSLEDVLTRLPASVRDRALLIQNELRPEKWQRHHLLPTLGIVWFEKRKGKMPNIVLPTVLFGRQSALLDEALTTLELPHRTVRTDEELVHELVLKNLYILGINLTGLRVGGVARELLTTHRTLFDDVIREILAVEVALLSATVPTSAAVPTSTAVPFSGATLNEGQLLRDLERAILADPEHSCAGRSAPRRLERTLENAARLFVETPILAQLAQERSWLARETK